MTIIIPAIDIINGQAVRLQQGDYSRKKEYMSPLQAAQTWQRFGAKMIHIVDLDGAKQGKPINLAIIGELIKLTNLQVQLGGGIRTDQDLQKVFDQGVNRVIIGSAAIRQPAMVETWLQKWGSEKIVLGADVLDQKIAISGWQEKSSLELSEFIDYWQRRKAKYFLITDISRDGMLQGANVELYARLKKEFPKVTLIASGGVSCQQDVDKLDRESIDYVVVGKALYEGKINIEPKLFSKI